MFKSNVFRIVDAVVFIVLVSIAAMSLSNRPATARIDSMILPEEMSRGFYEVLDSGSGVVEDPSTGGDDYYRYGIVKGSLDGEVVTKSDWRVLSNAIKYQIQADTVVLDFQDGTGIVIRKSDYPMGTYGKLQGTEITEDGKTIDVSDYSAVVNTIKEDETEDKKLQDITDIYAYLRTITNKDYTIFIAVNDESISALNKKLVELLSQLGMRTNLLETAEDDVYNKIYFRNSYYAVLSQGESLDEMASKEKIGTSGKLSDGTEYKIESAGFETNESRASIVVNGIERAVNRRGMNIVVYDNESHEVIDSVCFDTNTGLGCSR